jgi:hypothetical protein
MEIALQSLRHLPKKIKKDLFSENEHTKQNAIGYWYEAVIYERLLELAKQDADCVVVGKWNDVPWQKRKKPKLGQDGLFYDESGTIVARGNGQDLGEFDLLMTNSLNEMAFAEVTNSKNNLKRFDVEIDYKRRLIGALFSQPVQFVLISCLDLRNRPVVKRIASTPESYFTLTGGLDGIHSSLKLEDVLCRPPNQNNRFSPILLANLKTVNLNYLKLHNLCREKLINAAMSSKLPEFKGSSLLIKRIIVGYLNESSIKSLLDGKNMVIQGEKQSYESFHAFSRVVLALSMPDLRPALYLRLRAKPVYLKMGPFTTSTFEFERNICRRRTAFFDWLENVYFEIAPNLLNQIMNVCLNEGVAGSRRKAGESPDIVHGSTPGNVVYF